MINTRRDTPSIAAGAGFIAANILAALYATRLVRAAWEGAKAEQRRNQALKAAR